MKRKIQLILPITCYTFYSAARRQEFSLGLGAIPQRVWKRKSHQRAPGPGPNYSPGDKENEVPQKLKAEAVCRHCLQILTAETIKV